MFQKVFVANRGEIACRIFRTLRELGIGSVAMYHGDDRRAPHVGMADESALIEADAPVAAYLDHAAIVAAARRAGADAVHPGYGFLAENPDFARAVTDAGLVFIGPDPEAMRLMGDKLRARELAAAHDVPLLPGATCDGDPDTFLARVSPIGFPVLVKAAAGGGGKGMRIVHSAQELPAAVRAATAEAERYFGDGRVYAERYIERPRHVEVQVLGDGRGNVVHLFERECSIQRRHQKIIEEAPAPGLPAALRESLVLAAVRLAAAARYRNAGTVEFIVAPDGSFHFLEMNVRLQVEHPVTEMVYGIDLVAEQLRIAAGADPSVTTREPRPRGHAIECRICAERPDDDFSPATGRIAVLRIPEGPGIRFDGGIREGQPVTPAFDSLLGKLIASGADREEARMRLLAALDRLVILGVPTNIDYLRRVLRNAEFVAGRLHTALLAQEAECLAPAASPAAQRAIAAIAAAHTDPDFRRCAYAVPEPYASIGAWRN
jgi:propionyl-CoA carboxylase alpha chain/3-methylcrotonyl-CoA carboxylase alpha subunit/acetyl-CoA/propionyl-CoA carboxylase biotin carboxyl carrier protein